MPGPVAHPKSPAKAKKANMAVPPKGNLYAAKLNVPGQKSPTENPQREHPKRDRGG